MKNLLKIKSLTLFWTRPRPKIWPGFLQFSQQYLWWFHHQRAKIILIAGYLCVCVCTIWIDVQLLITAGGRWGTLQSAANEDAAMFLWKRTCIIYIYIYVCIVPPLGTYKSQLGDIYFIAVVLYGQRLLWIYIYIYYMYIYIYIYIYISVISSCYIIAVGVLHVWCIPQHNSQRQFWASVCVCVSKPKRAWSFGCSTGAPHSVAKAVCRKTACAALTSSRHVVFSSGKKTAVMQLKLVQGIRPI